MTDTGPFKIDNEIDRSNFLEYLKNNEKKVLRDLSEHLWKICNEDISLVFTKQDIFLSLFDKIQDPLYRQNTSQINYFYLLIDFV